MTHFGIQTNDEEEDFQRLSNRIKKSDRDDSIAMIRGPLNSGHDKPSFTYNNVKILLKKTSREWLKIVLRTVFRINKLIQIGWGKFKPEIDEKEETFSRINFVLLFEFVPLALGKLVYSEEPFGDGSLNALCQQVVEPVSAPRK